MVRRMCTYQGYLLLTGPSTPNFLGKKSHILALRSRQKDIGLKFLLSDPKNDRSELNLLISDIKKIKIHIMIRVKRAEFFNVRKIKGAQGKF